MFVYRCSSISYLSSLLEKEDRSVRIVAGEALALIFEIGVIEKSSVDPISASDITGQESKPQESYVHIQGLKGKVINQVKNLAVEAGGKGSAKKDLNNQRDLFRNISEFFEVLWVPFLLLSLDMYVGSYCAHRISLILPFDIIIVWLLSGGHYEDWW